MTIERVFIEMAGSHLFKYLTYPQYEGVRLNLGCGYTHLSGCVNVDNNPDCEPDRLCDIEKDTWPWLTNSVDYVCAVSVLEHVRGLLHVLGEMWRVCKPGAAVEVIVPYFLHSCSIEDPTHVRFFGQRSPLYWNAETYDKNTSWYSKDRFHFVMTNAMAIMDHGEREAQLSHLRTLLHRPSALIHPVVRESLQLLLDDRYGNEMIRHILFRLKATKPLPPEKKQIVVWVPDTESK